MKSSNTILATTKAAILLISFSFIASASLKAQVYSADSSKESVNEIALNDPFSSVRASEKSSDVITLPSFTMDGEYESISQYVADRLVFPENAIATGTSGLFKMRIKILSDGSVGETTIITSPGADFNEAVLALMEDMPKWNPAKSGNKPVDSVYTLQLNFRLQ